MRILVVEDDVEFSGMLTRVLNGAGYTVELAFDGAEGLRRAVSHRYSLIVLDLMLPRKDGLALCAEFRARRGTTPILMITARDAVTDRVRGLETGADDYLPKPFDVREFLARIGALIRRDRVLKTPTIRVANLTVETKLRSGRVNGEPLSLTRLEYAILEILAGQVGRTVLRETLLDVVWQDREPGSNKLDVAMRSLRKKLKAAGVEGAIRTVYGVGFCFSTEREG